MWSSCQISNFWFTLGLESESGLPMQGHSNWPINLYRNPTWNCHATFTLSSSLFRCEILSQKCDVCYTQYLHFALRWADKCFVLHFYYPLASMTTDGVLSDYGSRMHCGAILRVLFRLTQKWPAADSILTFFQERSLKQGSPVNGWLHVCCIYVWLN